ncbi:alpha/beta fold hydrolase [Streptomyces fuscigenes]|uniref:alpha/beta fold hydrolase n=1 Tax=Streptomyces fuscigenes TaxID=1528880 RepID=UPI001F3BB18C|nr:alpha/beta fold hydrolase [Streptomyces fuscigenes]MCF3961464.1 alpha/beta hydrolase [Streptomyces fuscigenes]
MTDLHLSDGRILEYRSAGPDDGPVLLVHYGTPSAAVPFEPMIATAVRFGLRFVATSRPGYAGSSPQPGRRVASVVDDTAELLDELGAERFVTVGWSGGGPHALACAALMPGRCRAAASVAGVAPHDAEGLDWPAGMGADNIEEFGAARAGEAQLARYLGGQAEVLAVVRAEQIAAALGDLVSDVDLRALTPELAEYLAASFRAAVSTGIAGWRDDDLAFVKDWGFDPAAIETPVSLWQGTEDRMVPADHGRWLARRMPAATAHVLPSEGHLSLVANDFDDIVGELAAHLD